MTTLDTDQSAASVADKPSTMSAAGTSTTTGVVDTAVETAGEAIQQTKEVARDAKQHVVALLEQTREELQEQTDHRTQQMSESLRTLSAQLRSLREGRPEEAGPLHHYLIDAEQKVSMWAGRLESGGPQLVLQDVRSFARRKPGSFLVAAIGAGFVVGRLARAGGSAPQERSDRHDGSGPRQVVGSQAGMAAGFGLGASDGDAPLAAGTFA